MRESLIERYLCLGAAFGASAKTEGVCNHGRTGCGVASGWFPTNHITVTGRRSDSDMRLVVQAISDNLTSGVTLCRQSNGCAVLHVIHLPLGSAATKVPL